MNWTVLNDVIVNINMILEIKRLVPDLNRMYMFFQINQCFGLLTDSMVTSLVSVKNPKHWFVRKKTNIPNLDPEYIVLFPTSQLYLLQCVAIAKM